MARCSLPSENSPLWANLGDSGFDLIKADSLAFLVSLGFM